MTSTVQCRFYARGMCRYGDSCRFSHGQNQNVQGSFQRQLDPNLQAAINTSTQNIEKNKEFIMESMFKDMDEWEKGHIWPFSSYGPIGGKVSIPYFEDLSVEELRYQTLQNNGNPPQEIAQKHSDWNKMRMFILQNPQTAKSLIEQVTNISRSHTSSLPQLQTESNFFMQTQHQQLPSPSIFGGSSSPIQNQAFGQNSQFGTVSIGVPTQAPASFRFSLPQAQQEGSTEATGMDSLDMQSTPTNFQEFSFNKAMEQNIPSKPPPFTFTLGNQAQVPTSFVTPPSGLQNFTNPLIPQQQVSYIPGSQQQSTGTGFFQPSNFTTGVTQQETVTGTVNKFVYSELSDLTADQIMEYEADNFTNCESIPLKPPTREMCLKY